MSYFYSRMVDPAALASAWERVRYNAAPYYAAAGGDGVTVAEFADNADERLSKLLLDLRAGTYFPGRLRIVGIPKRDGTTRRLMIPSVNDRIVQTAAASVLGPVLDLEFEDSSFGYRPGKSHHDAVRQVRKFRREGFTHVVDADIEDFFESVPHEPLIAILERSLERLGKHDEQLIDLISSMLEAASPALGGTGRGLPTGSPLSPLLSNQFLDDFDEAMEARGVRLVRFADDFLLLAKSEAAARRALARAHEVLGEVELTLNESKTRLTTFDAGFRYLGHLFVRSLVFPSPEDLDPLPGSAPGQRLMEAWQDLDKQSETSEGKSNTASGADQIRPLYITQAGLRLDAQRGAFRLFSEESDRPLLSVQGNLVNRIEVMPGNEITERALDLCSAEGIILSRLDGWGHARGSFVPPLLSASSRTATARLYAQSALVHDPVRAREFALTLVDARIRNQRALLRRLNRKERLAEVQAACEGLNRCLRKLPFAESLQAVRGHEGEAASLYWPNYARCLPEGWWVDRRRRRERVMDPANIALNMLSGFLVRDLHTFLLRRFLHPGLGILHRGTSVPEAFLYDVIEPYRAPLAEALLPWLISRKALMLDHFIKTDKGSFRLTREGHRRLANGYETYVDRLVKEPATGERVSWRTLLDNEVRRLSKSIDDEGGAAFYLMDY